MNIEVKHIKRNFLFAESAGGVKHLGIGEVAPSALLETQRPNRGNVYTAGKASLCIHYLADMRVVNKIVIHFATISAKGREPVVRSPEIKCAAIGLSLIHI